MELQTIGSLAYGTQYSLLTTLHCTYQCRNCVKLKRKLKYKNIDLIPFKVFFIKEI